VVLADSSVWIRFTANRQPEADGLGRLLKWDLVFGHELVYGELLMGDRGGRRSLLAAYRLMNQAETVPHEEVVSFVRHRSLHGRGVGWIDIHLLASAVVEGVRLWTTDQRLAALARELGVAYELPSP
jgi:predicted nucleic acid-binding protein